MVEWRDINYRRIGLQAAFWSVMFVLLIMILSNFVNLSNTNQLSAYDDDWNDMSAFRQDIKDMGIETRSLVSSPLLLADIEDPRNTTYIVAGVERDTLSLPQFDEDGFITIASEEATFGVNGVDIGLFCSTPMVALSRNITRKKAFEMLTTGDFLDPFQAEELGLINKVANSKDLSDCSLERAEKIASKLSLAVKIGKKAFYRQAEMEIDDAYA